MEREAGAMTGEVNVEDGMEYWVWIGCRGTESPCMVARQRMRGGESGRWREMDEAVGGSAGVFKA